MQQPFQFGAFTGQQPFGMQMPGLNGMQPGSIVSLASLQAPAGQKRAAKAKAGAKKKGKTAQTAAITWGEIDRQTCNQIMGSLEITLNPINMCRYSDFDCRRIVAWAIGVKLWEPVPWSNDEADANKVLVLLL